MQQHRTPHEIAGMVGRIIVGRPGGPGSLPFDRPGPWQAIPVTARAAFPSAKRIMAERVVRAPATVVCGSSG